MSDRTQYVTKTLICAACQQSTAFYVPLMGRVEVALLCDPCLAARVAAVKALRPAAGAVQTCRHGHAMVEGNILMHRRQGQPAYASCRACAATHRTTHRQRQRGQSTEGRVQHDPSHCTLHTEHLLLLRQA
jgi:hypothetical protein